jgi:hypothetical protein
MSMRANGRVVYRARDRRGERRNFAREEIES